MKIIDEIIELLSSESPNLNNALFKTKVLLHNLGEKEIIKWVNYEINGYENEEDLPDYRILNDLSVYGDVTNGQVLHQNYPIPIMGLEEKMRQDLEKTNLKQSVAVLESYAQDESDLQISIIPEFFPFLSKSLSSGFRVGRAWRVHSAGSILQILTKIRSRLLDFILELSDRLPNDLNSKQMKEKSKEINTSDLFKNAVLGDNATIIIGDGNIQKVKNTTNKNDLESLLLNLRKHNILEEDLEILKSAIESDRNSPELKKKEFGENVKGWISIMLKKSMDSVWSIKLSIAANLLTEALKSYYGF